MKLKCPNCGNKELYWLSKCDCGRIICDLCTEYVQVNNGAYSVCQFCYHNNYCQNCEKQIVTDTIDNAHICHFCGKNFCKDCVEDFFDSEIGYEINCCKWCYERRYNKR